MKIKKEDKLFIKAYFNWCVSKGYKPYEYEISNFIENCNLDHRNMVELYLEELESKFDKKN